MASPLTRSHAVDGSVVGPAAEPPHLRAARTSAARQFARAHGVLARIEANRDFGRGHVDAQVVARRWQCPVESVVVLHNGPLTNEQQMCVSLLAAPIGTVVGALSAALCDGMHGFRPDSLTLVAPGSARNHRRSACDAVDWPVSLKWSTMLGPEDVMSQASPPRTRLPRSILDAASERVSKARARVLVLAAVQQRLTQPPAMWDALSRRGRCRNRVIIAQSILDAVGGIESLPEQAYDMILRDRRLPRPRRQQPVQRQDGRYYLDNDWPEFGVRAEIHGIPHIRVANWNEDLLRQNDITISDGGLLVFSSYAVRYQARRVGDQTEAMLRRRGWRG
jgi:hypothetical protein